MGVISGRLSMISGHLINAVCANLLIEFMVLFLSLSFLSYFRSALAAILSVYLRRSWAAGGTIDRTQSPEFNLHFIRTIIRMHYLMVVFYNP